MGFNPFWNYRKRQEYHNTNAGMELLEGPVQIPSFYIAGGGQVVRRGFETNATTIIVDQQPVATSLTDYSQDTQTDSYVLTGLTKVGNT